MDDLSEEIGYANEDLDDVDDFDPSEDINISSFEELKVAPEAVVEVRKAWADFKACYSTPEKAAESVYNSIFESAPTLQELFKTPKAIQSMRFMAEINSFVDLLDDPRQLKNHAETLASRHLNLEVTVPRVMIFRDAIVEAIAMELGDNFSPTAQSAFMALLGWVGGANIFVKANFADRLRVLGESWRKVNNAATKADEAAAAARKKAEEEEAKSKEGVEKDGAEGNSDDSTTDGATGTQQVQTTTAQKAPPTSGGGCLSCCFGKRQSGAAGDFDQVGSTSESMKDGMSNGNGNGNGTFVPTTFREMFDFNSAVMGFGGSQWMEQILDNFDKIVTNVTDAARLQEECDMLSVKIDKVSRGQAINLAQFKSCMLASLRSILAKDWDTSYEVAWNWLWENVERLIVRNLDKSHGRQQVLSSLLGSLDDDYRYKLRADIYDRFFISTPAGQDFFKQSDTRLHFIAEKVFQMTQELFQNPWQMTDDLSALGLRHVGYGIPTVHFGAFVTACVEVIGTTECSSEAQEAFRWSLGLIAKGLVRTILEGSTAVMKAVNANSRKMVEKAVSLAPRGSRMQWLLKVEVGTQSISPLYWSIESGNLAAAEAMLRDLLVIRADRERYYYGVDALFLRHQDIIGRLCSDAPSLLKPLLDGLVWRSTRHHAGLRRANYYVKHLIVNETGEPAPALRELCIIKDPKIMVHPVVVAASDHIWSRVAKRQFAVSKIWFVVSLIAFMSSQAMLPKVPVLATIYEVRVVIFICRVFIYIGTMCRLLAYHAAKSGKDIRDGKWRRVMCCIPLPRYLDKSMIAKGNFTLMLLLVLMMFQEPMIHCAIDHPEDWPTDDCEGIDETKRLYSAFCMLAMGLHWTLMVDLAVFSTGLSAFVLVCAQVLSEIGRFLVALIFLLLTFGSALSVLEHGYFEMRDIPNTVLSLFSITVLLYEDDYRTIMYEPALLIGVMLFVLSSSILLMNLLIAQLNNSYTFINQDMVGYARLNRATVIVDTTAIMSHDKWTAFVQGCAFDEPLEFNEGDVGVPGGIQLLEPQSEYTVLTDTVMRFGGSCATEMPWPDEMAKHDAHDAMGKLENMAKKALRRITVELKSSKKGRKHGGVGSSTGAPGVSDDASGGLSGGLSGVSGASMLSD
eukprot:TRINITY_DN13411_c0_g1_i1.p1 TRINITY_DN13411_c0_g1~~TRINITY_DN13411_c0_g1_i1.p1  ORF type:complete len:1134 (-),score=238.44 TRINITY_DN13411_c0_g1_i1:110-3511(-)